MDSVQIKNSIPFIYDPPTPTPKMNQISPHSEQLRLHYFDDFDEVSIRKHSNNLEDREEFAKRSTNRQHTQNNQDDLQLLSYEKNKSQKTTFKIELHNEDKNQKQSQKTVHTQNFQQTTGMIQSQEVYKSSCDSPKKTLNKFRALGNLVVGVRRMQQNVVEQISNVEELGQKLLDTPQNIYKSNRAKIHPVYVSAPENLNDLLNNLKLADRFIYHAQRGSKNDIMKMIKLLQLDPKRNTRSPQDPSHIINCPNKYGQNAFYIAAKNGNLTVIQFLVKMEANVHIKSRVFDDQFESPLGVCCRWNHLDCLRVLLNSYQFTNQELKEALILTNNREIKNSLKQHITSGCLCCF